MSEEQNLADEMADLTDEELAQRVRGAFQATWPRNVKHSIYREAARRFAGDRR